MRFFFFLSELRGTSLISLATEAVSTWLPEMSACARHCVGSFVEEVAPKLGFEGKVRFDR